MAAAKCSQCGFVGARGNEVCKRCGASLYQTHPSHQTTDNNRPKVIAFGIASAIVVLVGGLWFASSVLPRSTPAPAEVAALLSADTEVSQPLTISLPTELKQTILQDDAPEWVLLQAHTEVLVLKQLGFTTVDSTKIKSAKRDCRRYRTNLSVDAGDFDRGRKIPDLYPVPWREPEHIPDPN